MLLAVSLAVKLISFFLSPLAELIQHSPDGGRKQAESINQQRVAVEEAEGQGQQEVELRVRDAAVQAVQRQEVVVRERGELELSVAN